MPAPTSQLTSVTARLAKLEAILNTAVTAIVTIDSDGTIDSVNSVTAAMFGYAAHELIGQNVKILMPEPFSSQHDGYIASYLRTGNRKIIGLGREVTARRKDGSTFPMHLAVSEFEANGERRFAGIISDRTERRAVQDALSEAERRLSHAQKMEAVGQLAGGIAHDFNNLLTVIVGNLELIELGLRDDNLRRLLRQVQDAAAGGAELTQHLLGFSRQLPLQPQNVKLNDLLVRTLGLLRRTLGDHINLSTVLAHDLWDVRADPSQIESAITNLAINARDAMPNGGRIVIETRNQKVDAELVAAGLDLSPGEYVIISVSDTGTGIPPEIRPRIFEPFFTTKPKGRGTGLGLAMIYGFAKQSGGHVTVYSEIGYGTTFMLYLPRLVGAAVKATPEEVPEANEETTGGLVLLVEDDAALRNLNVERLHDLGYKVVEASSGVEALQFIKDGLRPDLVFTDMIMPGGVSGRELLEQVRRIAPSIPFLLTSGYSEEMVSPDGRSPLPAQLLQKPYRMVDLAKALRRALVDPPTS